MSSPCRAVAEVGSTQFRYVGCGGVSKVYRLAFTGIALKIPYKRGEAHEVEKRIYERLGQHPFILHYYGESESVHGKGLVVQYLHAGTLGRNLELHKFPGKRTR